MCQSLKTASGTLACPADFDRRAISIAECSGATSPPDSTQESTTAPIEKVVPDVAAAVGLAANAPSASVIVEGGARVQVSVGGEPNALVHVLASGAGIGVFSPNRDGNESSSSNGGLLRDGLSFILLFDADRPVSMTRLVLGEWDSSDSARLEVSNHSSPAPIVNVSIIAADSALHAQQEALSGGFTKYVIVAGQGAQFSLKSFAFVERGANANQAPQDSGAANFPEPTPLLGTTEIALIATACAVALLIVAAVIAVFVCRRRRNNNEASNGEQAGSQLTPASTMSLGATPAEMHSFVDQPRTSEYGAIAPLIAGPPLVPDGRQSSLYGAAPSTPMYDSAPVPSSAPPVYVSAPHTPPIAQMYEDPESALRI